MVKRPSQHRKAIVYEDDEGEGLNLPGEGIRLAGQGMSIRKIGVKKRKIPSPFPSKNVRKTTYKRRKRLPLEDDLEGEGIKKQFKKVKKGFKGKKLRKKTRTVGKVLKVSGEVIKMASKYSVLPGQELILDKIAAISSATGTALVKHGKGKMTKMEAAAEIAGAIGDQMDNPFIKGMSDLTRLRQKAKRGKRVDKEEAKRKEEELQKMAEVIANRIINEKKIEVDIETPNGESNGESNGEVGETNGEIEGHGRKKRAPSKYNLFVKKHRRAGLSMREVGALWRKSK